MRVEGPARSPTGVLTELRALSVDLLAVQVRGSDGVVLAGDPALPGHVVREAVGELELAAGLGPQALEELVRHDLRAAMTANTPSVGGVSVPRRAQTSEGGSR